MHRKEKAANSRPRLEVLSAIEGARLVQADTDILATTEHDTRYPEDLELMRSDGIRSFRCCIPWHRIERMRGVYDWSWVDAYLSVVREKGLRPIIDACHLAGCPDWLKDGFADPDFPKAYERFLANEFAPRYPWIRDYTIICEPYLSGLFCGELGQWHPHHQGDACFVPMVGNMAKAICAITERLIEQVPDVRFVHVDTCEKHLGFDEAGEVRARFLNQKRFLVHDLVLGRVDRFHPLYRYLIEHGMSAWDLTWLRKHPARIDVLGLDFYTHSQTAWNEEGEIARFEADGFTSVALEYVDRYRLPVMLSETNIRGTVADRLTWLKYMYQECEELALELEARRLSFEGFCWYAFVDSTDWGSLLRKAERSIDPQGIYWLDADFDRNASELSEVYSKLARGCIDSTGIPAYRFEQHAIEHCKAGNFLHHMRDWNWRTPSPKAA